MIALPEGFTFRQFEGDYVRQHMPQLARLAEQVFSEYDVADMLDRYPRFSGWCLFEIISPNNESAAFKLGHDEGQKSFYSWLGGVAPDYRGHGLGRYLMEVQHGWARKVGYRQLTTRTEIGNDRMAALNIAAGFKDCGTITKEDGRVMRCFAKAL